MQLNYPNYIKHYEPLIQILGMKAKHIGHNSNDITQSPKKYGMHQLQL